jgi:hypothetical protein
MTVEILFSGENGVEKFIFVWLFLTSFSGKACASPSSSPLENTCSRFKFQFSLFNTILLNTLVIDGSRTILVFYFKKGVWNFYLDLFFIIWKIISLFDFFFLIYTCKVQFWSFCKNSTNLGIIPVVITSSIGGLLIYFFLIELIGPRASGSMLI